MIRLMLDIETFSRRADAAVFEVAILPFHEDGTVDPPGTKSFRHWLWTPETGHFEGQTVAWWMGRGGLPHMPQACLLSEEDNAERIHDYLRGFPEDTELWAGPSSFDCVILQQLLDRWDLEMPLGFRQWRDLTTLRAAAGFPRVPRVHKKHEALSDCLHQIAVWAECRRLLGLGGGQPNRTLPATPAPQCSEVGSTGSRPAEPATRQFAGPPAGCPNGAPLPSDQGVAESAGGRLRSLPTCQEFAGASTSLARGTPGDLRVEMKEPPVGIDDGEFWKECAAQHLRNEEFYRGLLDQCAVHLGPEVFTSGDGSVQDEPLRLKIPGLVCALAAGGPAILTASQVAYLEEKRAGATWSTEDFNQHLRSMRG